MGCLIETIYGRTTDASYASLYAFSSLLPSVGGFPLDGQKCFVYVFEVGGGIFDETRLHNMSKPLTGTTHFN